MGDSAGGADRSESESDASFRMVIEELEGAIAKSQRVAVAAFGAGVVATGLAMVFLYWQAELVGHQIVDNEGVPAFAIYAIVRGAALTVIVSAILYGIWSLGRASLDQATRYQKRLMAAHFMNHILVDFQPLIANGKIKLTEVIGAIDAWSRNVESAYTHVKFGRKPQDLRISLNRDGASFSETSAPPPNGRADWPARP